VAFLTHYWKFIIAIIGAVTALVTKMADDGVFGDYGPVVVSFLTALAILVGPSNKPAPLAPPQ
jgi:asparagine N-glycosylation enzyme membrane subunit Stt3